MAKIITLTNDDDDTDLKAIHTTQVQWSMHLRRESNPNL